MGVRVIINSTPQEVPYMYATAAPATVMPADANENIALVLPLPGNLLTADGGIYLTGMFSMPASANAKTIRCRFGTTGTVADTLIGQFGSGGTTVMINSQFIVQNQGNHTHQLGADIVSGATTLAVVYTTVDTKAQSFLTLTFQKAAGAEVCTFERYEARLIYPFPG